jgi:hypothetical protein
MAESLVLSLNGHRSNRVAAILSGFPRIHWAILSVLSFSLGICFLLESNNGVSACLFSCAGQG